MRQPARLGIFTLLCVLGALGLAGCNSQDQALLSSGVGTNLYTSALPAETQELESYIADICVQAGMAARGPDCAVAGRITTNWMLFVQAGMNDIDQRCDNYLQWLDDRRRTSNALLHQIGDTQSGVEAGMAAAGVAPLPIAIAAAAFGFARNTFTNLNSRLLLEVDHSTVQAVVLSRQIDFRNKLPAIIDNQPAAVYALRSYLRICMPYTIETDINNTITVFARGGGAPDPLVTPNNRQAQIVRHASAPLPAVVRSARVDNSGADSSGIQVRVSASSFADMLSKACITASPDSPEARTSLIDYLRVHGLKKNNLDAIVIHDYNELIFAKSRGLGC